MFELAAKRRKTVFPSEAPLYYSELDRHQEEELRFLTSRYAPTHYISCENLKKESVIAAKKLKDELGSISKQGIDEQELNRLIRTIMNVSGDGAANVHEELNYHTSLALLWHLKTGRLEITCCCSCGADDLRVAGDQNRLQKCGSCKQRKRQAKKLAVRLSQQRMRNDSISVFCEDLVGNHILRSISKDFVGGGGVTGRRPTDPLWYMQSSTRALQSSSLAQIYSDLDLIEIPLSIETGHLFSVAFASYQKRFDCTLISVDRAFSLLMMLKMKQIVLATCKDCGCVNICPGVCDEKVCFFCEIEKQIVTPVRKSNRRQYGPQIVLEVNHEI